MTLTEEILSYHHIQRAAGSRIFDRGLMYYHQGRVEVESVDGDFATCLVRGSNSYYEVLLELAHGKLYFTCNCPFAGGGAICKHEVAAALAVRDYLRTHAPVNWRIQLSKTVQLAQVAQRPHTPQRYLLFLSLQGVTNFGLMSWKVIPYQLPLNALPEEIRPIAGTLSPSRIADLIATTPGLAAQVKSPFNAINPAGCANASRQSVAVANYLLDRARVYAYYTSPAMDISLLVSMDVPLFLGSPVVPIQGALDVLPERGRIWLEVVRLPEGIRLTLKATVGERSFVFKKGEVNIVTRSPFWVLADHYLFEIEDDLPEALITPFFETPDLIIPKKDEGEFLEKYYLPLATQVPVQGEAITWQEVKAEPVKRLYLSDAAGELQAQLRFGYGEHEVSYDPRPLPESVHSLPDSWTLLRVHRVPEFEQRAYDSLSSVETGLKRISSPALPGLFSLRARVHPIDFLMRHIPRLTQAGFEIYGEEKLKTGRVNRNQPTISFNISSGIDWFDVKAVVNFGDLEVSFKEIRKALRKKERFIKLADGTIGDIPEEWIERYKHLFALGEETDEGVRLSNHHVTLLDQLLGEADRVHTDAEFDRRRKRLRDFSGIAAKQLPTGFVGELRPYQKAGFDWLHFLHEFEFGGCLADDMGLGKTIQVLALFQSLRESNHPKTADLIVVPRSLLVNWQREAARFTPNLRLLEHFGNNRSKDISIFNQVDLVITTYGVMLRDVQLLRQYPFHYVLLDESQAIKNPLAQSAKATRLLRAEHRLVLTGTPVENSTSELWSQFAFLNPGLLGNIDYFKEEFGTPIEKKGDEHAAQFLRKMVFPFILRRTKDQVTPELPPRTERILYCDMEPAQSKFYNRTRDYYRGILLGMLEKQGMDNTRMKILEGLLRLRQICNHPRLVDNMFRGDSAKFELLMETLDTLRAEGHKALIFSQFVEMLKLVRTNLDIRRIPYTYLDGHTQNRQERVDTFQDDPKIPFFLISLRAGGVGLNLTAADYVIHIDPWWNPAVEMQATDRTHRIGQDKPVFVYKLIVRDSVEEKILLLQERKKNLVDQLITTESSFFKSLTAEDVKVLFS